MIGAWWIVAFHFGDRGFVCVVLVAVIVFLATSTRRSARRCRRCKEVNRDGAVYCAQCGANLQAKK